MTGSSFYIAALGSFMVAVTLPFEGPVGSVIIYYTLLGVTMPRRRIVAIVKLYRYAIGPLNLY